MHKNQIPLLGSGVCVCDVNIFFFKDLSIL